METKKTVSSESGQALFIIVLSILAIVGFAGLALDGTRLYTERRKAQHAADNAAIAGARAKCLDQDITDAAMFIASQNEYDDNQTTNWVTVNNPPTVGSYSNPYNFVEVIIRSRVPSMLIQLVNPSVMEVTVRAVGYCRDSIPSGVGAIFAGSQTCNNAIDISGSSNTIIGGLHSNKDVKISGSDSDILGGATYVTDFQISGSSVNVDPPQNQTTPKPFPSLYNIIDFAPGGSKAVQADALGQYYSCTCKMDKGWLEDQGLYDNSTRVIQDGLYYTTGEIAISMSELIGMAVTFVSRDKISFSGSSHTLSPYIDGLLAFTDYQPNGHCSTFTVKMSGSDNEWQGILYVPYGKVEFSGSDNSTVHGAIIADTVKLSGSKLYIQFDPSLIPVVPQIDLWE
ncbi:MAG: Tad domain-containing protein [Chloroflexota bacterium]